MPDISIGEKVTTTLLVVNEVVTSRFDGVGVKKFVVLGTILTAAIWLGLN